MKFGVREICNVVFRAKSAQKIGTMNVQEGQPVLYLDTATTSTLEGAATTVYAQGGRGNARLIAWEGERTLTFTVEDALLSPVGFAMLSGAGLIGNASQSVHVHQTTQQLMGTDGSIDLSDALTTAGSGDTAGEVGDKIDSTSPIYVMNVEEDGSISGMSSLTFTVSDDGKKLNATTTPSAAQSVLVDYYVKRTGKVSEMQIDAEHFGGYYYVEADTLFRRQDSGRDMPANITFPNVKIQSNFTFSMASTGDPSTFTFTMDAFPGYTYFDNTKKVLCVIQMIDDSQSVNDTWDSVMKHSGTDSSVGGINAGSGNLAGYKDEDSVVSTNGATGSSGKVNS